MSLANSGSIAPTRLFIIGNGFDRFHGIPSSYGHFADYLKRTDRDTFRLVEDYFNVDRDFWNCFEERLAMFDADAVMDHAEQFLMSYGADDWRDSGHHDYEYEIEQVTTGLTTRLYDHFGAWIRSLPIPESRTERRLRGLEPTAAYLSFNYTPTLERVYGVPLGNTLHIHGRAGNVGERLILGHAWSPADRPTFSAHINEDTDTRVAGGYELIDEYFKATFKPSDRIIAEQRPFFESLRDVREIYVLGHSLSDVDESYFAEILERIDRDRCLWTISYHSNEAEMRERFEGYGIRSDLVRYVALSEL